MDDYEPIDISVHVNAGTDVLNGPLRPAVGSVKLRGIPFLIGSSTGGSNCYTAFGDGFRTTPLRVEINRRVGSIIVAHLVLDSAIPDNAPIGEHVADYVVELDGGRAVVCPIRELLEIGVLPRPDVSMADMRAWFVAATPFLASPDQFPVPFPRHEGPWRLAGRRLTEAEQGMSEGYKLWRWHDPERPHVKAIEIRPGSRPFLVAGITVGLTDEDPFITIGREPVRITFLRPDDAARPEDVELNVDRGIATYVRPLLGARASGTGASMPIGWGEPAATSASPGYAELAATPSATLEVTQAGERVGAVKWGDVVRDGSAEDAGRVRVEWVDRTRTWIHTTVLDEATGRPVPCRVHFRSASGIPYQPHGHHSHVNGDLPSWHMDVGGDVRLGAVSYAVIDGRCQGWLPVGDVLVEVVRGFEYEPLRTVVRIEADQRRLELAIRRWVDLFGRDWVSGDTHVHFLSVDGGHLEAAAEDLRVVNLLQAQWGHLFTNTEDFTGRPSVSSDYGTIVHVGQENRQHLLGHLGLLGLRAPVMPWSSDGANEAEVGGSLETTLSHWADEGRAQGALVTVPHFGHPNGEVAALIATGRVDAVEMIRMGRYGHEEYYRYLNAGYRLPLVGGTDKMTSEVPVGLYRTYVRLQPGEPLSFDAWARNVVRGRTFLSAGPIIGLEVEGAGVGDTIRMPVGGGTVHVEATAESATPIHCLQILAAGRVVAEARALEGSRRLEIREAIQVESDTWLAARAGGPGYYDAALYLDAFERAAFAHTSPVYVACGRDDWTMDDEGTILYMLTRIDAVRAYVEHAAPRKRLGGGGHPHGESDHLAYLDRPLIEARERLLERQREKRLTGQQARAAPPEDEVSG